MTKLVASSLAAEPSQIPDSPLMQAKDLCKTYIVRRGAFGHRVLCLKALDRVSLEVHSGKVMGCVGESGCGKSTLAKLMVLLERPTSGQVLYRGQSLYDLSPQQMKAYRRSVQIVFQDPYSSLAPRMSVATVLREPLEIHRLGTPAEQNERARELIQLVGLDVTDLPRFPHQFSGGQRQRICIAQALMLRPELLILDEPVSALDVSIQSQILNLLLRLQRELGLSLFIISHDLRVIRYMCDLIIVMYLGRAVEAGPIEAVFTNPAHPYVEALLKSIPQPSGYRYRPKRFSHLEGDVPSPLNAPSGCSFHPRCPRRQTLSADQALLCQKEAPEMSPLGEGRSAACHFV